MKNTIILCAGKSKFSDSLAMVPVNGKPVIGWILDDLFQKGILDLVMVIRPQDRRLTDFVHWAYDQRMKISLVSPGGESILHSVQAGLRDCETGCPIRIILGDTLIRDGFTDTADFVYTGIVEDARRWCLVTTSAQGEVLEYIDKPGSFAPSQVALAGYYHLGDGDFLRQVLLESLRENERELSAMLRRYGKKYPIRARQAQDWYDFGHIDNLVDARRRLLHPRFFNALSIHPVVNTITKVSDNNQKLQDELDWYLALPDDLQALTPRILRHENVNGCIRIVQEYYGYPTLAELYVYGDLDIEIWESILRKVWMVHREFLQHRGELSDAEIDDIYMGKTLERVRALSRNPYWASLLDKPEIQFNGQPLRNVHQILAVLAPDIKRLAVSAPVGIIHGDFCFSNILFDINNQIIRLIDPRGRFGRKGIYGDLRYDIAKLRHSISGLYDFILADMFTVSEVASGIFSGRVFTNGIQPSLKDYFDYLVEQDGYSLREVRLIEGLLFISMLPYHQDHLDRQKMLYLAGLVLLNEVIDENCN
ncbi:MAG: sugar phosphate nucleotidyltransferase [Anaerolineales bacterium]